MAGAAQGALVTAALAVATSAATAFAVVAAADASPSPGEPGAVGAAATRERCAVAAQVAARADALERRLAAVESLVRDAANAAANGDPAAAPAGGAAASEEPRTVGSGRVFISADAVDRLLRRPRTSVVETPAEPRMPVARIAEDLGVPPAKAAALADVVRAHEEEMVRLLLGDGTMEELRTRIVEGQSDAARMAALEQTVADNGLRNFGRLVHGRELLRERVAALVGDDVAAKFVARRREPSIDVVVAAFADTE